MRWGCVGGLIPGDGNTSAFGNAERLRNVR